jgi:hypothetical protein
MYRTHQNFEYIVNKYSALCAKAPPARGRCIDRGTALTQPTNGADVSAGQRDTVSDSARTISGDCRVPSQSVYQFQYIGLMQRTRYTLVQMFDALKEREVVAS